jgi:hypothetical protein
MNTKSEETIYHSARSAEFEGKKTVNLNFGIPKWPWERR